MRITQHGGARRTASGLSRSMLLSISGAIIVAGALAGCSAGGGEPESPAADPVIAVAPVGELSGITDRAAALLPGEEVQVLVDTPDLSWTITSSDSKVVRLEDTDKNPGRVRVIAVGSGEATITFDGGSDDAQDSLHVAVQEPTP